MGYLEGIGFWSIVFSIGLLGTLIDGLYRRSWGGILFSLAFLAIVNSTTLGIEELTPWTVLGAALLGTIGLNIVFPSKKWNNAYQYIQINGNDHSKREEYTETDSADGSKTVNCEVVFGSIAKYLKGESLKMVNMENVFGSLDVYFTDTMLKNYACSVNGEIVFGKTGLYVPADWKVICNVESVFGHVREHGKSNSDGVNVLTINGEIVFGKLDIYYI